MKINTNNVVRPLVSGLDLTQNEREEYDHIDDDDLAGYQFFRYRNQMYYLGDFMRCGVDERFGKKWHGYLAQSFFHGLLVRISHDGDGVIVGEYFAD